MTLQSDRPGHPAPVPAGDPQRLRPPPRRAVRSREGPSREAASLPPPLRTVAQQRHHRGLLPPPRHADEARLPERELRHRPSATPATTLPPRADRRKPRILGGAVLATLSRDLAGRVGNTCEFM
uniref:Uncharacterized protein n=1 Tax=Steinernema glaseri TaxID=37863 RepID=A0A1I8AEG7_9BILA